MTRRKNQKRRGKNVREKIESESIIRRNVDKRQEKGKSDEVGGTRRRRREKEQ